MQLNDYELLYYCYQENEASFRLLAKKYERYIYYMITLFKKNYYFFSYEDSDLHNEALILLYECVFNYRDDLSVKFSSYYLACLKRKYLYIIRKLASNKTRAHSLALSLDSSSSSEDLDLYSIIDNGNTCVAEQVNNTYEIEISLKKLKKNLNNTEKKILYFYLKGYSYDEIAFKTDVNNKKIDNTIQKYKRVVKQ